MDLITQLALEASRLPIGMPEFRPDSGQGPVPAESRLSREARAHMAAWKPLIEKADLGNSIAGPYGKSFRTTYELVIAQMLTNTARLRRETWHREATTAATDVPSYARQNIAMILRAFPRMFTLQLFPVTPFSGPDGRIYFLTSKYNTAYAGSTPNIADGDRLDDLTKFNVDFAQRDEGLATRNLKRTITSLTATVKSYRISSEWTYEAEDDTSSLYNMDLGAALIEDMSFLLAWTTDRVMLNAAVADANTSKTWTAQPAGYSSLTPSEKKAYDETIWADGVLPTITAMQSLRTFNTYPDWMVCDPTTSERVQKLSSFVPVPNIKDGLVVTAQTGALRDVGALSNGMRIIVDPQMTANTLLQIGRAHV